MISVTKQYSFINKDMVLTRYFNCFKRAKVSFIRKVDAHGRIEVNGVTYFIRRKLEGQYVIATIFTYRKRLVVKQDNKIIKSFPFPIKEKPVPSLFHIRTKKP